MKKLILIGLLFVGLYASAQPLATNLVTSGAGGNAFLLLADRANVYSVEIGVSASITAPALVKLYDNASMADPVFGTNYVTAAYTGRSSYVTNVVTSYVGFNGLTNWYTNSYLHTYDVSVDAATNALSPSVSLVVAPGTYSVYNTDALFNRGIVAHTSTNISIVINYRSGR